LLGGIREHQGLVDPVFMKTTTAFERGLEGREMVAPPTGQIWALETGPPFDLKKIGWHSFLTN
jgi:hypothetical protein